MIGSTISHYRILEKLGQGGMGVVYKAEDTKLKRTVALKFLAPTFHASEDDRRRFVHEAQASAALSHPNIATVFEIDKSEGETFIALEYVEGQSLAEKIESGPVKLDDALSIAIQLSEGINAAHQKGIVHRDIKSNNIMVTPGGQVKILDFGLAKLRGASIVTKASTTVGTMGYMSPEQLRGEAVDQRTDIWAVGVVLYEMIAGKRPFRGEYQDAVAYQVVNQQPEPLTAVRTDVPIELERVVKKAMQKDRSERYQALGDLLVDLRSVKKESGSLRIKTVPVRRPPVRRLYIYGSIAALSLVLIVGVFYFNLPDAKTIDSIAVLPLKNLMGDPEQEYFVEGMHEALITELSKMSALKVISRTSAMQYNGASKSVPQIARELGVEGVIEGSVMREGNQVRITVQLIDGATDKHLWADSFDRELRGVLALHSDVARAIAERIEAKLTPEEQVQFIAVPTVNPKAYELYLLGRHHWAQRTFHGYTQAIKNFQNALEEDPAYGSAYAALADTYILLGDQGGMPQKEALSLAATALRKALTLDQYLADAHVSQGVWKLYYEWNWVEAEKEFRRAIELKPGYALAYQSYGRTLGFAGRFDEAVANLQRARELDPLSPIIGAYIGQVYLFARQFDRADDQLQKTLESHPDHPLALHNVGELRLAQGRYADAIAPSEKSAELSGSSHYVTILGCAYARAGRMRDAVKILGDLQRRARKGLVSTVDMANLYLALGEREKALTLLDQAYEQRDVRLAELKAWPWFDSLRDDGRFQNLLRRMNFPVQ